MDWYMSAGSQNFHPSFDALMKADLYEITAKPYFIHVLDPYIPETLILLFHKQFFQQGRVGYSGQRGHFD